MNAEQLKALSPKPLLNELALQIQVAQAIAAIPEVWREDVRLNTDANSDVLCDIGDFRISIRPCEPQKSAS